MPKVKNPLLSMEARGGIGGLVYNTWRGINYVKTNTSPTGQGTPKRLAAQALLVTIAVLWKGISDVQRAAWGVYAADHPVADWTGSPKRLTGQNFFMKCNVQLSRFDLATISDPPATAAPSPMTGLTLAVNGADLEIDWTYPPAAGGMCDVYAVGPISAGVAARIEQAQYKTAYGTGPPGPHVIFTAATPGRYTVFARNYDIATGLVSTWVSAFCDMV